MKQQMNNISQKRDGFHRLSPSLNVIVDEQIILHGMDIINHSQNDFVRLCS